MRPRRGGGRESAIIAGRATAAHHEPVMERSVGGVSGCVRRRSETERAQLAARPRAFPDRVEDLAKLPRAARARERGLAVETVAELAVVIPAGVAGDEGVGAGAIDRVGQFAELEYAGQALRQR